MFGTTTEDNVDVRQSTTLEPGIYTEYQLVSVTSAPIEKKDGSHGKDVITFTFKKDSSIHTHLEWDTDDETKAKNLSKRIKHILKATGVSEEDVNNKANSFADYGNKIVAIPLTNALVDFKIVGNVWNGKKSCGFTNYLGFIVESGNPLSFSSKENDANIEYMAFEPVAATEDILDNKQIESDSTLPF